MNRKTILSIIEEARNTNRRVFRFAATICHPSLITSETEVVIIETKATNYQDAFNNAILQMLGYAELAEQKQISKSFELNFLMPESDFLKIKETNNATNRK